MAYWNRQAMSLGDNIPAHTHSTDSDGGSSLGDGATPSYPTSAILNTATIQSLVMPQSIARSSYLQFGPQLDTVSGNKNNYNPSISGSGNGWIYAILTISGSNNITGLDAAWANPGIIVIMECKSTGTATFKDQSASSTAANRMDLNGSDIAVSNNVIAFIYDYSASRWKLMFYSGFPLTASGSPFSDLDASGTWETTAQIDLGSVSAATNDQVIGSVSHVLISPSGATRAFNGMVKVKNKQRVIITNYSTTQTLNINHDNASSTAANRFYNSGNAAYTLQPNDSVEAIYDQNVSRWRTIGH